MTPSTLGFQFPAEWEIHRATWLSFPQNLETWEERLPKVLIEYLNFVEHISRGETVEIIARDAGHAQEVQQLLEKKKIFANVYPFGTNDSWCRDHGPAFLKNKHDKCVVNWEYNAWGNKYPPYDLDNEIPLRVGQQLGLPVFNPKIVMEGGSVEFNGEGDLLTTEACLLNPNRNPHLTKLEIEEYLVHYYGVKKIHWLKDGIIGDDTDGHIDDTVRFVNANTVIAAVEHLKTDENYSPLKENIEILEKLELHNGEPLKIIELPMPKPVYSNGIRLPASYANFYICNAGVLVPIFHCSNDEKALDILQGLFPNKKVFGLSALEIIWGLGSFHCLSQQEPL